jgi:hypothetical protein
MDTKSYSHRLIQGAYARDRLAVKPQDKPLLLRPKKLVESMVRSHRLGSLSPRILALVSCFGVRVTLKRQYDGVGASPSNRREAMVWCFRQASGR